MGTLVLFSGGMDSTIALFWAIHNCEPPVHALTFDYAQRHRREIGQSLKIWKYVRDTTPFGDLLGFRTTTVLVLPRVGPLMSGAIPVKQYDEMPTEAEAHADPAFIPYRNLIFLSHAAAHARACGCKLIVTGLRGGFPDCTANFEQLFQSIANNADPSWFLEVTSPVHDSRAKCVELARGLAYCLPALALTHTCFAGTEEPCGKCLPCIKRAEGFAQVGIADPLLHGKEWGLERNSDHG